MDEQSSGKLTVSTERKQAGQDRAELRERPLGGLLYRPGRDWLSEPKESREQEKSPLNAPR